MRIVSTEEMKELELTNYESYHFTESLIVENVGKAAADYMFDSVLDKSTDIPVLFLIGKGNNGADGLAISRHLVNKGVEVRAFVCFGDDSELKDETEKQLQMAKAFGVKVNYIKQVGTIQEYFERSGNQFVVVDALFGTGIRLPLPQFFYDVINYVNTYSPLILSVDIPSGIDGNTGHHQGAAINADITMAIGLPKLGFFVSEGAKHVGQIEVIDAGFPTELLEKGDKFLLTEENIGFLAGPRRNKFADKKSFGHSVVIGGSHGLTGALALASTAALKVGAGLVTAATWENQYAEFLSRLPAEIMTGYIPSDTDDWNKLIRDLYKYDSILIGPGLARSENARKITIDILESYDGPVILDADAINVLNVKEDTSLFTGRRAPTILTPHFGEFSRFSGVPYETLVSEPVKHLTELIDKINSAVILKGPCTYIGFPNGNILFNYYPNDGMASAGSGDVLAGTLGGLLGQERQKNAGLSLFQRYENLNKTICLGVLIHSIAGKIAAKNLGVRAMSATSIIEAFPEAFKYLSENMKGYQINN